MDSIANPNLDSSKGAPGTSSSMSGSGAINPGRRVDIKTGGLGTNFMSHFRLEVCNLTRACLVFHSIPWMFYDRILLMLLFWGPGLSCRISAALIQNFGKHAARTTSSSLITRSHYRFLMLRCCSRVLLHVGWNRCIIEFPTLLGTSFAISCKLVWAKICTKPSCASFYT